MEGISLIGKWMASENCSNKERRRIGTKIRKYLGLNYKEYRKLLTTLRERIKVLEKLMSEGRFDEIQFDKIPSRAGFKYRNFFARHDLTAKRYKEFITSDKTIVNSKDLFVHEIVAEALNCTKYGKNDSLEREAVNKYWANLPDFFEGKSGNILCVCDTSGSMCGNGKNSPINVSIGLSMYCAERLNGPFRNHFITFSSKPKLVEITGANFVEKARKIYRKSINDNTNLEAVFDLLLNTATKRKMSQADLPDKIVIISDMEIDEATRIYTGNWTYTNWTRENANTMMEDMSTRWAAAGYKIPKLVYWNVNARNNTFLQLPNERASFISGWSQNTMKALLSDKSGIDLMFEILNSDRYMRIE